MLFQVFIYWVFPRNSEIEVASKSKTPCPTPIPERRDFSGGFLFNEETLFLIYCVAISMMDLRRLNTLFSSIYILLLLLDTANSETERCIDYICMPKNYSKSILPLEKVDVLCNFDEIRIAKVNDEEFSITLSFHLLMRWKEPRLKSDIDYPIMKYDLFKDLIWLPDIYVIDSKPSGKRTKDVNLSFISDSKYMEYDIDLEIVIYCAMIFDDYPLGRHHDHF